MTRGDSGNLIYPRQPREHLICGLWNNTLYNNQNPRGAFSGSVHTVTGEEEVDEGFLDCWNIINTKLWKPPQDQPTYEGPIKRQFEMVTDGDRVTAGVNARVERNIIDIEMTFPSSWGTITTELQGSLAPGICYWGISLGNVVEHHTFAIHWELTTYSFCFGIFENAIQKTSMPILRLATTNLVCIFSPLLSSMSKSKISEWIVASHS